LDYCVYACLVQPQRQPGIQTSQAVVLVTNADARALILLVTVPEPAFFAYLGCPPWCRPPCPLPRPLGLPRRINIGSPRQRGICPAARPASPPSSRLSEFENRAHSCPSTQDQHSRYNGLVSKAVLCLNARDHTASCSDHQSFWGQDSKRAGSARPLSHLPNLIV
jgi:hypothetical protein